MLSIMQSTPKEIMEMIAIRGKSTRLALGLTQVGLEKRSGVSLGSIKRFENSGQISLESLLKIAVVLGSLEDFEHVFSKKNHPLPRIDVLMTEHKIRKRGSIK